MASKVVVVLSGGMDSAVLLAYFRSQGVEVHAISFNYGQRHSVELAYASDLATKEAASHEVIDLSCLRHLFKGSSQTDDAVAVPHGHYAEESMKKTVVPNRNMIMISIAAAHAIALKADVVAFGAHAGDHAIYPDCRPEFVKALARAIELADWGTTLLTAPFVTSTKVEICKLGSKLGVDFTATWSCYDPQYAPEDRAVAYPLHCGKCGTCVERKEAFALSGVPDLTEYA